MAVFQKNLKKCSDRCENICEYQKNVLPLHRFALGAGVTY